MSFIELPLHYGSVPKWLFRRMVSLASEIMTIIVNEYGTRELMNRISDPLWFQALSNILGFDWDSSGSTTVTTAVLRLALKKANLDIIVAGGKGKAALQTLETLDREGYSIGAPSQVIKELKRISRIAAKVDSCLLQDGYSIYHHAVFLSSEGYWAIVQQGMNPDTRLARRYHWNFNLKSVVIEPHSGLLGFIVHNKVLNLTSRESEHLQKLIIDLVNENPVRLKREIRILRDVRRSDLTLCKWMGIKEPKRMIGFRIDPNSVNWKALESAYQIRPRTMEELLLVRGLGSATIRALALIGEIVYGCKADWRDPLRFGYAFGGKDGVPYPVNRYLMDKVVKILEDAINEARIGRKDKLMMLRKLKGFVSKAKGIYYLRNVVPSQ